MIKTIKIFGIIIFILGLILVRKYESSLFYDPFLEFFKKSNFNHLSPPNFHTIRLFISLSLRYSLNLILSLLIIYLWFGDKKISVFSFYIFTIGFAIFCALYFVSICTNFSLGYMPTFYIRRILIQPIFLLILIPAIYYHKHLKKTNSPNYSQ